MSIKKKTHENSIIELTDEQLNSVHGGAVSFFMRINDIEGDSTRAHSGGTGKTSVRALYLTKYVDYSA